MAVWLETAGMFVYDYKRKYGSKIGDLGLQLKLRLHSPQSLLQCTRTREDNPIRLFLLHQPRKKLTTEVLLNHLDLMLNLRVLVVQHHVERFYLMRTVLSPCFLLR